MSNSSRELICISCPMGCHLKLSFAGTLEEISDESEIEVTGNRCHRGEIYAGEELLRPSRTVTATISSGEHFPRIPVKSRTPVLRGDIPAVLNDLYKICVPPPVKCGEVLAEIRGVVFSATRSIRDINE